MTKRLRFPDEEPDEPVVADPVVIDQALHDRPHNGPIDEYGHRDFADVSERYYCLEGEELDD